MIFNTIITTIPLLVNYLVNNVVCLPKYVGLGEGEIDGDNDGEIDELID